MTKLKTTKRDRGAKTAIAENSTIPDFGEWSIDHIDRHIAFLRKTMVSALNEVIRQSFREGAYVRFAQRQPKGALNLIASFLGMSPTEGDLPPEVKFSLRDVFRLTLAL